LMAEQRARSKTKTAEVAIAVDGSRPTEFVGYETTEVLTAIVAYQDLGDGTFQAKLERSPFYPEGGGQVSDFGVIEHEETGARADLIRATRVGDDQVLTFEGAGFAEGDHTATHLLHQALRDLLGDQVRQAGSAVRPDKLRFDFTYDRALTPEEREQVERAVNERVFQNLPVRTFVTPIDEARKLGAMMLFGEKYGDEVRVVEIDDYSRELCGGTHVRSTAEIGPFVILTEGSVGSGARRIEAVTAGEAWSWLRARAEESEELRAEVQQLRKGAGRKQASAEAEITYRDEYNGIVVAEVAALKGSDLKDLSDRIRQSKQADAVLLGSIDEGRAYLVVNLDRALVDKGIDAVEVARKAARKIGGGGGGRSDLAEAGGKNPEGLAEAYEVAKSEIASALK
jgi:alanyl-tRNA synthetase